MRSRQYLALYFASAGVMLAALLGIVLIADPYGLYGTNVAPRLTANKFRLEAYERSTKPANVCRKSPAAVILGTSRSAAGLNPETLARWSGPAYSFALNGAYLMEVDETLRIAVACGVRTILYGLDFFTFTEPTPDFARQVKTMSPGFTWTKIEKMAELTISLKAVMDSLYTFWANLRGYRPTHDGNGMYVHYDPVNVPFRKPDAEKRRVFDGAYKEFDSMLAFARGHGADLRMFTSPVFGSHQRSDPVYSAWLAQVNEIAARHGYAIYDAASKAEYTAERSNFYDISHYRPSVGDRIIEAIFGPTPPANGKPAS